MDEYSREPCPHRIYADAGSAFTMGLVGGTFFHLFKGWKSAPTNGVLLNMGREVGMKSPVTGVQFAAWGGMFSVIDCAMVYWRQKEDPFNSIMSGAATGGLLCLRKGHKVAIASACFGGLILAMIEGVGIVMNRVLVSQQEAAGPPPPEPNDPKALKGGNVQKASIGSNSMMMA